MEKRKLISIFFLTIAFIVGGVFGAVAIFYMTGDETDKAVRIQENQSETVKQDKTEDEKNDSPQILSYKNTEYGFTFEYPETYFLVYGSGDTIIQLLPTEIAWNGKGRVSGGSIFFTKIDEGNAQELFNKLQREKAQHQREREKNCEGSEEFEQCAYYGGGTTYTLDTFGGEDAVFALFRGEGAPFLDIYIPGKSLSIFVEGGEELPSIVRDTFTFNHTEQILEDPKTGASFVCPAYWFCEYDEYSKKGESMYNLFSFEKQADIEIVLSPDDALKKWEDTNNWLGRISGGVENPSLYCSDFTGTVQNCEHGVLSSYTTGTLKIGEEEYQYTWYKQMQDRKNSKISLFSKERNIFIEIISDNFYLDEEFITQMLDTRASLNESV